MKKTHRRFTSTDKSDVKHLTALYHPEL